MKPLALAFGVIAFALGLLGLVAPNVLLGAAQHLVSPAWIYISAAIRIAIGVLLIRVASESRAPAALQVLGILTLAAGVITPFIGVDRAHAILQWLRGAGHGVLRLWAVIAMAYGGFIAYAVGEGVRYPSRPTRA